MNEFKKIENEAAGTRIEWSQLKSELKFDEHGLIAVIAQQFDTKEVLMMAWANAEAIELTRQTGQMHYFSRSRQKLWRKGESSGQTQAVKSLQLDCDADALLAHVDQNGAACHTGRRSCFFFNMEDDSVVIATEPLIKPSELYDN